MSPSMFDGGLETELGCEGGGRWGLRSHGISMRVSCESVEIT